MMKNLELEKKKQDKIDENNLRKARKLLRN